MTNGNTTHGLRRFGRHYSLLLWKNLILARRMPIRTFLEITLPVFFGLLLLAIRHIVKSETFKFGQTYKPFPIDQLPPFEIENITYIAYTPQTNFTNAVMERVAINLSMLSKLFKIVE